MTSSNDKPKTFLGVPMDVTTYDDETALTAYVWRHYRHLMTAIEKRAGSYLTPIVSDSVKKVRRLHELLEQRDGHVSDAAVKEALELGLPAFRTRVMKRLLTESASELVINRCRSCKRLARTPVTRHCTWCGAAWSVANALLP